MQTRARKKIELVDRDELEKIIDLLEDLDDREREFLKKRWFEASVVVGCEIDRGDASISPCEGLSWWEES